MRVLLIRTSALGDVVNCLPVLTALRRHRPEARIGWVIERSMAPLLEGHPDLDDLLLVDLRGWRKRPLAADTVAGVRRFLGDLRRFSADVVVDLMGNHKAGVLAALSLTDERIGARRVDRREPSSAVWINRAVAVEETHAVDRALALLDELGVPREAPDFGGDKLFPDAVPPVGLPDGYFVVHPGAAWANKRYPAELWGRAAAAIERQASLPGLVVHGPGEAELATAAIEASGGALAHAATEDLAELGSLLRGARLALGGDTGPTHLAHALGTPVLCLLGPTDPAKHGVPGELGNLWRQLPCSFCHRRFDEPKACLTTLPPEAVAERAAVLLAS